MNWKLLFDLNDSMPFIEINRIVSAMEALGWKCDVVDNGNIIFEKQGDVA